jgi:hypothetical protein
LICQAWAGIDAGRELGAPGDRALSSQRAICTQHSLHV